FCGALKRIGNLRNKFAHDLSTIISQKVVSDLFNALPEFGQKAVKISVDLLHKNLGHSGQSGEYQALIPKFQFVLIALNLERICCAAYDLLKNARVGSG
ncbi:MAG: hypothetical protein WBV21_12840, partial [Desulfobacterales bacterium]